MKRHSTTPDADPRAEPPAEPSRPWDGGEWVDVGNDGRWRPSPGERARSGLILLVVIGILLVLAAVASVGDGGDDRGVASGGSTSSSSVVTTSTTVPTTILDPASLAGEPPPPGCDDDDRGAEALRERPSTSVLVLNGTARNGQAGTTTDALKQLGYSTIVPGNAGSLATTKVEYVEGFCAEAVRLVTDLDIPGAEVGPLAPDSEVFLGRAELLVTLGRDSI